MTVTGIFRPTPSNGLSFRFRKTEKPRKPVRDDQHARKQLEAFAEALSEHGSVPKAAKEIGCGPSWGRVLMARLRADLGSQAV
jgi:hypothetical protein